MEEHIYGTQSLDEIFTYHAPRPEQLPKYAALRAAARDFARVICENCPSCADRTDAIRSIRNAVMTANAAVALDGLS